MKETTKFIATLFIGSTLAAAPALAANMDGVTRGPAKSDQGNMVTLPNTGSGAGAATDSGNTVVRGANKSPNAEGSGTDAMATGSVAATAGRLKTAHVSSVHVVNVKDMATSGKTTASAVATNTTPEEQQQIQAALASNADVMGKLKAQSVKLSQVVAASYDGNRTVTVYVR